MVLALAGQLFQLARLREVAVDELEVLGLFERFVIVRRLIAVGDDVAGEGRQNVGGVGIGRQGGHACEGAERAGDGGSAFGGGGLRRGRRAQGDGFPSGGARGFQMGIGGVAVAGQKIEKGHAAGDGGGVRRIAAIAECGEELAVGVARAGIAVAIQEFGVRGPGSHAVWIG